MTQQEYIQRLKKIGEKIDTGKIEEVVGELQEMEKYKPVRLQLDYLKTKCRLAQPEKHSSLIGDVVNKYMLGYNYPYLTEVLGAVSSAYAYRKSEANRRKMQYIKDSINDMGCHYDVLQELCTRYLESQEEGIEWKWYRELYSAGEVLGMLVHYVFNEACGKKQEILNALVQMTKGCNLDYFKEQLMDDNSFPFVIFEDEHNKLLVEIILKELKAINKQVFCIEKPLEYANDLVEIKDTIVISIQCCSEKKGIVCFKPIEVIRSDGRRESNIMYLLEYIKKKYSNNRCINILASGFSIDEMTQHTIKGTFFSRLSDYRFDILEHTMAYAIYGNYLSYISNIYCKDCEMLINKNPTIRFSIVIPARNSGLFLRHTIQTCLEQRFEGAYEIIVSDNSTEENAEIYNLCQELNDEKIIYIKTPRELRLAKSFEFASLHTRGEYVLTLGSDDGLLPWALEILDAVTQTYPMEEIIQWERGFYAWPGFSSAQENQFVIPNGYEKGKLKLHYKTREHYLEEVMNDSSKMYSLPLLYINSCFKRSYMNNLLNMTGCLWDGICQDIYMGVINVALKDKILNMCYPLSIAGMSKGSVGAASVKCTETNEKYKEIVKDIRKDNEMGGYYLKPLERYLPLTGTDSSSLYTSILRAIEIGVLNIEQLGELLNWESMFIQLYSEMNICDVSYDKQIHSMRYAAMKLGEEFLQWFDEKIYHEALEPIYVEGKLSPKIKRFKEEKLANGGMILDASKYEVHNVYDATKLFENLTGL